MSQYQAKCATNTFRVKSITDLKDSLEGEGFTVITDCGRFGSGSDSILLVVHDESVREVSLFADGQHGRWPDLYDCEREVECGGLGGVLSALRGHLVADSVAVFTEVGADAWDLVGHSVAVNAEGEAISLQLSDIVDVARKHFGGVVQV